MDQNRQPDNSCISLVHYNNLDKGSVPSFPTGKNVNYINEPVVTAPWLEISNSANT